MPTAARVLLGKETQAVVLQGTHRHILAAVVVARVQSVGLAVRQAAMAARGLRRQLPDRPSLMLAAAAAAHLLELLELAVAVAAARGA
jgi:hypothetical protein